MDDENDKKKLPLVTLKMSTYNQERYVRDAVRGALSQTYEPLQIVISDDHSTDSTWEIVLEEVETYKKRGGIHKDIFLNRNGENLGIARHFQLSTTFCKGEIVVCNAGDDISMPNRVERIVRSWKEQTHKPLVVLHDCIAIDNDGNVCPKDWSEDDEPSLDGWILGAAASYARCVFSAFPAIRLSETCEDNVYARRALLLGSGVMLHEALVKYRLWAGVTRSGDLVERAAKNYHRIIMAALQTDLDIEYASRVGMEGNVERVRKAVVADVLKFGNRWIINGGKVKGILLKLRWVALVFRAIRMSGFKIKLVYDMSGIFLPRCLNKCIGKLICGHLG